MAWSYKRSITIDNTKCGTADSTDIPIVIAGTYDGTGGEPDLRSVANGGKIAQANAYDLAFYSDLALTTLLKFERVSHNLSTGAIEYWVKIPTLKGTGTGTDTVIYMAYGNGSATELADPTNVWTSSFAGVWHFEEDPQGSAPQMLDSTSNNNDGTSQGTMLTEDSIAAKIGKGLNLDGGDDYIRVADADSIDIGTSDLTLSIWIKPNESSGDAVFFDKRIGGGPYTGYLLYASSVNQIMCQINDDSTNTIVEANTGFMSTNAWHHLAITVDRDSATGGIFYYDGTQLGTAQDLTAGQLTIATAVDLGIGSSPSFSAGVTGGIDEARVATAARSPSWMLAEYNNQNAPDSFYSLGTEVSLLSSFVPKIIIS